MNKTPSSLHLSSPYLSQNAVKQQNNDDSQRFAEGRQSHVMNSPEITFAGETCVKPNPGVLLQFPNFYSNEFQQRPASSPSYPTNDLYSVQRSTSIVASRPLNVHHATDVYTSDITLPSSHHRDIVSGSSLPTSKQRDTSVVQSGTTLNKRVDSKTTLEKRSLDEAAQFDTFATYIQRVPNGHFGNGILTACFVVFVDFWSRFLKYDALFAKTFFATHHHIFLPQRQLDIEDMKLITSFDQLQMSRHVQKWIHKRFQVSISRLGYKLLFNFLSEPENTSMLYCVINCISFHVKDDWGSDMEDDFFVLDTEEDKKDNTKNDIVEEYDGYDASVKPEPSIEKDLPEVTITEKANEVHWGLLSGPFNKIERLSSRDEVPWYFSTTKETLAIINGEITLPVDPNLALSLTNESEWAINAWYELNSERTSRMIARQSSTNFPSVLSFNLDCITDELTKVKLSHWSSSPWLLAARESGIIGVWDIPTLLNCSQDFPETRSPDTDASADMICTDSQPDDVPNIKNKTVPLPQVLISHDHSVTALSFVPLATPARSSATTVLREQHCLSAAADGFIRLWNLPQASALASYEAHQAPVWSLDVSLFGNFFLSGGGDGLGCMFCFSRGYPLRVFSGHLSDVQVVKCSPNTILLATGSLDATIKLWDIRTAKALHTLKYKSSPITHLAFSPNGRLVSSSINTGDVSTVVIWDIAVQKRLATIPLHQEMGHVTALAFSYGSHTLAIGCSNGALVFLCVAELNTDFIPNSSHFSIDQDVSGTEESAVLRVLPLGERFPDDVVFTPENVVAVCSVPMTNPPWIPSL